MYHGLTSAFTWPPYSELVLHSPDSFERSDLIIIRESPRAPYLLRVLSTKSENVSVMTRGVFAGREVDPWMRTSGLKAETTIQTERTAGGSRRSIAASVIPRNARYSSLLSLERFICAIHAMNSDLNVQYDVN